MEWNGGQTNKAQAIAKEFFIAPRSRSRDIEKPTQGSASTHYDSLVSTVGQSLLLVSRK
jgi:hypothetical protein